MGAGSGTEEGGLRNQAFAPSSSLLRLRNPCIPSLFPSHSHQGPGPRYRLEPKAHLELTRSRAKRLPLAAPSAHIQHVSFESRRAPLQWPTTAWPQSTPQAVLPRTTFEPRNPEARNHWFQQERDLQGSGLETELRSKTGEPAPLTQPLGLVLSTPEVLRAETDPDVEYLSSFWRHGIPRSLPSQA